MREHSDDVGRVLEAKRSGPGDRERLADLLLAKINVDQCRAGG
jgi:hypothetical protein